MQKLYLSAVSFNNARILAKIADIVEQKGGKFVSDYQTKLSKYNLENRAMSVNTDDLVGKSSGQLDMDPSQLPKRYNIPIESLYLITNFVRDIHFYLDGKLIYISMNNNPLLPYAFIKSNAVQTDDGTAYTTSHVGEAKHFSASSFPFEIYDAVVPDAMIKETADAIFDKIMCCEDAKGPASSRKYHIVRK